MNIEGYKMEMTFYSKISPVAIQQLVKRFDGRFVFNPYLQFKDYAYKISFDDVDNANKFSLMEHIMTQPFF